MRGNGRAVSSPAVVFMSGWHGVRALRGDEEAARRAWRWSMRAYMQEGKMRRSSWAASTDSAWLDGWVNLISWDGCGLMDR
jgi:hypothetical protein